eukprot:TRINITY_DN109776_c0_g1_i1.p1 TRINITY_DN109776_c0_g1~~TRINITY_DN109776_c0_g1_i1.p1  ORF type:complete len:360 (+),score=62.57 TRINITY_DN109776_c0_g1_i1:88-1167(+)
MSAEYLDDGGAPAQDNVSLLRILSDVQALLAAQRRIEWKLTGLSKAQLAVNTSIDDVRQDVRDIRSRLSGGGGVEPEAPRGRPKSSSRTALAIRSLSRSKSMAGTPKTRAEEEAGPDSPTGMNSRKRPTQLSLEGGEPGSPGGNGPASPRSAASRQQAPRKPPGPGEQQEEVLRLRRDDGRMFTQVGRWKKTWGTARTSTECRLPGLEVKGSEAPGGTVERLLEGRLGVLSRGIELTGTSEQAVLVREFKRFRMTSTKRYHQTIYDAIMDASFRVPIQCIAATAGSFTSTPWRTRGPVGVRVPEQDIIALWHEGVVYLYSWLTVEELDHFASPSGDGTLSQWIATVVIDEESLQKVISL